MQQRVTKSQQVHKDKMCSKHAWCAVRVIQGRLEKNKSNTIKSRQHLKEKEDRRGTQ